jgi:hypothetical protein
VGDISLALASLSSELPTHVTGLDIGQLVGEDGEAQTIRKQVEEALSEEPDLESLPPSVLRAVLERAIQKGKFLSAARCLELLDEMDDYIEKYIGQARQLAGEGKFAEAAAALVVVSNLDLSDGIPLFQYSGPGLHEGCTSSADKCITQIGSDEAILQGLRYLLGSEKMGEVAAALSSEVRKALLAHVVLDRDPNAGKFFADYRKAHTDLEEIETGAIADLRATVQHAKNQVSKLNQSLEQMSSQAVSSKETLEKVTRTANSLRKEFADAEQLVEAWQTTRLRRRFEQLIEARNELEEIKEALEKAGSPQVPGITSLLDVIDDLSRKEILQSIDDVEQRLISTQATMLGRRVHSQEHWQFLREIAFKYPVSPLMCCLRKINDRWMVVPQWESEITTVLREHFERQGMVSQ